MAVSQKEKTEITHNQLKATALKLASFTPVKVI